MADVDFIDNTPKILEAVEDTTSRILKMIGIKAEKYAKALCPTGTPESTGKKGYRGGTLKRSITHQVNGDTLTIGSNVEYAPYVELGTGPHYTPPPEWEQFNVPRSSGVGHGYVTARPYLRPAIADHIDAYKKLAENEYRNA